jgi:hypothetical protein
VRDHIRQDEDFKNFTGSFEANLYLIALLISDNIVKTLFKRKTYRAVKVFVPIVPALHFTARALFQK